MIRKAYKKDAQAVAKLLSQLGCEIKEKTGAIINTDKALITTLFKNNLNTKFQGFVYEEDKKIKGVILFYYSFSLYAKGEFLTVTELFVQKEYRKQGVGKKLLDSIIDTIKNRSITRIELTTPPLPEFQKTLEFYLNSGFEITGGKKVKYEL